MVIRPFLSRHLPYCRLYWVPSGQEKIVWGLGISPPPIGPNSVFNPLAPLPPVPLLLLLCVDGAIGAVEVAGGVDVGQLPLASSGSGGHVC